MKENNKDKLTWRKLKYDEVVKHIFDHFKNLGVCGAVYYVGIYLLKHPDIGESREFRPQDIRLLGWYVIFVASLLTILNIGLFMKVLDQLVPGVKVGKRGTTWPAGWIFAFLYVPVVVAVIVVGILAKQ